MVATKLLTGTSHLPASSIDSFWSLVDQSGGTEACWPWTGPRDAEGYGRFRVPHGQRAPHLLAFDLAGGTVALGHVVRQQCDNPLCCNHHHLSSS